MLFDWHEIARLSQVVETSQSLEVAPGMTARSLVSTQTPSFQTNIPAQRVPVFLSETKLHAAVSPKVTTAVSSVFLSCRARKSFFELDRW